MVKMRPGARVPSVRRDVSDDRATAEGDRAGHTTERRTRTYRDFAIMWAAALIGAAVLRATDDAQFERFLGVVPPIVAVAGAGLAGAAALRTLDRAGWVGIDPRRQGLTRSTGLAVAFGAAILIADATLGFDEGVNIAWPVSLLFYPVMGFIAEVALHLVPLALVIAGSRRVGAGRITADHALAPMVFVALIEAGYQLVGSATSGTSLWLLAYLALHMTAFGTVGLSALRRHGFASMMWLRLVYYLIWHVVWGALRLEILF